MLKKMSPASVHLVVAYSADSHTVSQGADTLLLEKHNAQ